MSKLFSILIFLLTYTTTVTANACVEVYPACYNSATMVKYDNNTSVSSINLGTQVTGANIFINGNFIIDQDFEFLNCQIHVTTGGSITVLKDKVLKLTNTTIVGCDFMWQGVLLEETSKLFMTANCKIGDAANGVWATKNNYLEISNSIIANCITGVRIQDPNPIYPLNYTTTSGFVVGTQIFMMGNMLPPYNGQPLHGYKPYASVYIDNNILFRVGDNAALTNVFQHGTFGVYATNSIVKITNTEFAFIQPSSYYNGKYAAAVTGYGTANGNLCSITVSPLANKLLPNIHECTIGIWANNANVYAIENFIKKCRQRHQRNKQQHPKNRKHF
nr:hypothetical protein [Bacteroidota bacterium]